MLPSLLPHQSVIVYWFLRHFDALRHREISWNRKKNQPNRLFLPSILQCLRCLRVAISIMVTCDDNVIVQYNRRTPELCNALLLVRWDTNIIDVELSKDQTTNHTFNLLQRFTKSATCCFIVPCFDNSSVLPWHRISGTMILRPVFLNISA